MGDRPLISADLARARRGEFAFLEVSPWRERVERVDASPGGIPGARTANVRRDFAGTPRDDSGHLPLPALDRVRAVHRSAVGDRPDRPLVIYTRHADELSSATRAWFMLTLAGVADVRVLDGGLPAWVRAGGPLGPVPGAPVDPVLGRVLDRAFDGVQGTADPGDAPSTTLRVLELDEVADVARYGTLLDARSASAFHGAPGPDRSGHVPGAVHAPAGELVDGDGLLLPPIALRRWFLARGAIGNHVVGAYCGGGVASSSLVFAGALIGQPIGLYVDSWSQWRRSPDLPVEAGTPQTRPSSSDLDCIDELVDPVA